MLPAAALKPGATEVEIEFTAGDASLNRNPDFLYALFVPARAHLAIPVFDQPDLKARWTLDAHVPGRMAGGQQRRAATRPDRSTLCERPAGSGSAVDDPLRRDRSRSPPISSPSSSATSRSRRPSATAAPSACSTARPTPRRWPATATRSSTSTRAAIAFMEDYTGIPYAFGKFDFVLIPAFQFGGMEHAGKILYNATGLLLDESATQNQLLGRASVISHETAHMWFGDLVTMRWFNDVWMKEVFANFMAAKIVNPSFPEVNHDLRFLLRALPGRLRGRSHAPAPTPIRQPLDNLNEAGSLYGAIIYQKAPIVMRHLEAAARRRVVPRRPARVPRRRTPSATPRGPTSSPCSTRARRSDLAAWSQRVGRAARAVRRSPPSSTCTAAASRGWPSARRDGRGRGLVVAAAAARRARSARRTADGHRRARRRPREPCRRWSAGRRRATCCRPAAAGPTAASCSIRCRAAISRARCGAIADPLTRGAAWVTLWESMLDGDASPATTFVDTALGRGAGGDRRAEPRPHPRATSAAPGGGT